MTLNLAQLAFFVFACSAIATALMVVLARNPVHSVLFLIATFIGVAGLFILMGAEYLAMLLIVVYVGAVAVLFLFVVMMLDVDFAELRAEFAGYLPVGASVAVIVFFQIAMVVGVWVFPDDATMARAHPIPTVVETKAIMDAPSNVEALGLVLYTDYVHFFQIAGMILLVAMIGAIVLTFRERNGVRKQDVVAQVARTREEGVEIVSVETGKGI